MFFVLLPSHTSAVLNLHMDPCYLCCFCVDAWAIQTCYLGRSQQGDPDSEISHCTHLMTVDIRQKSAHNSTYSPFWVATLPFYAFRSIFFSFFLFPFSFLALTVIRLLLLLRLLFVGHAIEPGATLCSSFSLQFCSSFRCPPQRWWRLVSLTACA